MRSTTTHDNLMLDNYNDNQHSFSQPSVHNGVTFREGWSGAWALVLPVLREQKQVVEVVFLLVPLGTKWVRSCRGAGCLSHCVQKKKKTAGAPFCWFCWEDQYGLGISCVKIASIRVISTKKSVPTHTSDDHGSPASIAPLRVKAEPAPGPEGPLRGQADPSSALWHRWLLQTGICKTLRPGRGRTSSCCETKPC